MHQSKKPVQHRQIAPTKQRALWKNYDMWSSIILVVNALAWLFIRNPGFGSSSVFMAAVPYELMVHLPGRINPAFPHPEYRNKTILNKRGWCNPLFVHKAIQGVLKKGKNMSVDEYLPLQTREVPINKKFLKMPPVKNFIKLYEKDSKSEDGRTTKFMYVGFRKMSATQMMPQTGLTEGAGWGIKKLELCIKKFPFGMYRKLRTDAIKANKTKSTPKTRAQIKSHTASMQWAAKWMRKWSDYKVQNASYDDFPCGQPDMCKLFRFGSEFRIIGKVGTAYAWLYLFGLIPIFLMLFDPPPAMPGCCDKIWNKYCAPFFPLCAAILMTAASTCGFVWWLMQKDLLEREVNTKYIQEAYSAANIRQLRGLPADAEVQGWEFSTGYGMSFIYNLVPTTLTAIIYWVLIILRDVKYPRFPSRIEERRKRFEEGYQKAKARVLDITQARPPPQAMP